MNKLQKLLSLTRQAVSAYSMIAAGDKIAVGLSGGKDSIALLYTLSYLRKFYTEPFELCAISVDLGLGIQNLTELHKLCQDLDVPYYVVKTNIQEIVFPQEPKIERTASPCYLCSKMRKGALNQKALELSCNKIAYGHHKNDVVETFFLSLLYEGRLQTFEPVTHLDKTGLTLIRPLCLIPEKIIKGFVYGQHLPVLKKSCPVDGKTKRATVKSLLKTIETVQPKVYDRVFHSICQSKLCGWHLTK